MPDLLAAAWSYPGLSWLAFAALIAGVVRGFSGFGTALIFMPVAAQVLPPLWAIIVVAVMDVVGPLPNIPSALRKGHPRDLARLLAGTLVCLPVGLLLLPFFQPEVFQSGVALVSLVTLLCLVLGLRYHGPFHPRLVYATGGAAGFLGGVAGIPGPPVILLYVASPKPAAVVRANTMAYLFFYDFLLLGVLAVQGLFEPMPVVIGLFLIVPNLAGNLIGAAIFRPEYERLYTWVAYMIIAASGLSALPIW